MPQLDPVHIVRLQETNDTPLTLARLSRSSYDIIASVSYSIGYGQAFIDALAIASIMEVVIVDIGVVCQTSYHMVSCRVAVVVYH